jgi:hypothetical protein
MASIYRLGTKWRAQVRLAGQPTRSQVFDTQKEAKDWARNEEAKKPSDLGDGGKPHTVASLIETYRGTLVKKTESREVALRIATTYIGHYRLAELTTKVFLDFIQKRRTTRFNTQNRGRPGVPGAATVMQDITYLKTALKHGANILDSRDAEVALVRIQKAISTARHQGSIGESERRTRRPTEQELLTLERHFYFRPKSKVPMWDIVLFAMATAMRLGEIVGPGGIVHEDVNDQDRTIWVRARKDPTTKGGRDDLVPLHAGPLSYRAEIIDPLNIIKQQFTFRFGSGRIFPYSEQTIGNAFARATEECGIKDLVFHDLRHEAISRMFEFGMAIPDVQLVSGHKEWRNLKRYTQLKPKGMVTNTTIKPDLNIENV